MGERSTVPGVSAPRPAFRWLRPALAGLAACLVAVPGVARADDLGVLVLPAVVWPAMLTFGLVLGVMLAINYLALRRAPGSTRRGFGVAMAVLAAFLDGLLVVLSLGADLYFSDLDHAWVIVVHLLVFQVVALPCFVLGVLQYRRLAATEDPAS